MKFYDIALAGEVFLDFSLYLRNRFFADWLSFGECPICYSFDLDGLGFERDVEGIGADQRRVDPARAGDRNGVGLERHRTGIADEIACMNSITAPEGREVGLRGNDQIAPIFQKLGKLSMVGKIHTHPQMDVFLSGTDRLGHVSGASFWVSMVANPQYKKLSAFGGNAAKACTILFCSAAPEAEA